MRSMLFRSLVGLVGLLLVSLVVYVYSLSRGTPSAEQAKSLPASPSLAFALNELLRRNTSYSHAELA